MRRTVLALAITALALGLAGGISAAQETPDDPTSHPGPGRRLVCLDGVRQLWLTPDEENIPGNAPIPGPCPGQSPPTTSTEIVTLCIQGVTTTGLRGSANPNGYLYPEGPCEGEGESTTTTSTTPTKKKTPSVRAQPRFTG
jgi:hypothetical protein